MVVKYNVHTGELAFDYPQLKEIFVDLSNKAQSSISKITESRERKRVKEFRMYRGFLTSRRKDAAILAESYYSQKGLAILNDEVPILYKPGWIPSTPIDLREVRLDWLSHQRFDLRNSIFSKENILPFSGERYSSLLLKYIEGIRLYDNPTYRLMSIENVEENSYLLKFGLDTYFNYIDTCELLAYEFCKKITRQVEKDKELSVHSIKDESELRLRSRLEPFDFTNRSAALGINTALIILDTKRPSKFYLHERSEFELAEAMNTISVVPAGTFQPAHKHDANHSKDFSLYNNLMREFAEELLGAKEFTDLSSRLTEITKVEDILGKINLLVRKGLIKVYFLGIGLDCLTLKPEMFTALVLEREVVDEFLWSKLVDSFEGKHLEAEFLPEGLRHFIEDEKIVPAGSACLWLLENNYSFFHNIC